MAAKLSPKHKRFVQQYLIDLNASAAYIRAGYAAKNADVAGPRLLGNVGIQEAIAKGQARIADKLEITQERVAAEYAKMGFANMLDYIKVGEDGLAYHDLSALTRDQAAAIQEFTIDEYAEGRGEDAVDVKKIKLKLSDKRANLDSLCKMLGFNAAERHELTGKDGGAIEINDARTSLAQELAKLVQPGTDSPSGSKSSG